MAPPFTGKSDASKFLDAIPFLQARHYHPTRLGPVVFIVEHDMESGEDWDEAEDWQRRTNTQERESSVNYGVDPDSILSAVKPTQTAWHASGVNSCSLGIEQPGRAAQSRDEWLDDYGKRMIANTGKLTAALCIVFEIEVRVASSDDVVNYYLGRPYRTGLISHLTATEAAKRLGKKNYGHWDPGYSYPWDFLLAQVRLWLPGAHSPVPRPEVTTMSRIVLDPTKPKRPGKRPHVELAPNNDAIVGYWGSVLDGADPASPGFAEVRVRKLATKAVSIESEVDDEGNALGVAAIRADHSTELIPWA